MLGKLIAKQVAKGVAKGTAAAGKAAKKGASKAASKTKSAVKGKLKGMLGTGAIGGALGSLFGGGDSAEGTTENGTPSSTETPTPSTGASGGDSATTGDADFNLPTISLPAPEVTPESIEQDINLTVSEDVFTLGELPIGTELKLDVQNAEELGLPGLETPIVTTLVNQVPVENIIDEGTEIPTRSMELGSLMALLSQMNNRFADLEAKVAELNGTVEDYADQRRREKLGEERRRDEEQTEKKSFGDRVKESAEFAKDMAIAGTTAALAKFAYPAIMAATGAVIDLFEEESEGEETAIPEETAESTGISTTEVVGGAAALAVGMKGAQIAGKKVGEKIAGRAVETAATETAETTARIVGREAVTGTAETGARGFAKHIPKIAKKKLASLMGKAVPGISWLVGGGLAIAKLMQGDTVGAGVALAGSVGGIATAIPATIYEIGREVYHATYDTWPEGDPLSKERWPPLYDAVKEYGESFFAKEEKDLAEEVAKDQPEATTPVETPLPTETQTNLPPAARETLNTVAQLLQPPTPQSTNTIVPIVMPRRSTGPKKPLSVDSRFVSTIESTTPSYSTRESFVELGFQS